MDYFDEAVDLGGFAVEVVGDGTLFWEGGSGIGKCFSTSVSSLRVPCADSSAKATRALANPVSVQ